MINQVIVKNLLLVLVLFSFACSSKHNKDKIKSASSDEKSNESKRITDVNLIDNLGNTVDAFYLSEIADSIELVQLEMKPNHLFVEENMQNVLLVDNNIFFYENKAGILKYSRTGKFEQQIGKIGRGPGEYMLIRNFYIDESRKIICGYLNWTGKLVTYNLDGKFIEETTPPESFGIKEYSLFYRFGNYYLAEHSPTMSDETQDTSQIFNFAIIDSVFNEVKTLIDPNWISRKQEILKNKYDPWDSWANFYQINPPTKKLRNKCLDYLYSGSDTIYRLTEKLHNEVRYVLNSGEKMPFEMRHCRLAPLKYFDFVVVTNFEETADYLFIDLAHKKNFYKARFRKSDGTTDMLKTQCEIKENYLAGKLYNRRRNGEKPAFTNDIIGTGIFEPRWTTEKTWTSAVPAYQLMRLNLDSLSHIEVKHPAVRDNLIKMIENMKETDGPVLMIAHLKNVE